MKNNLLLWLAGALLLAGCARAVPGPGGVNHPAQQNKPYVVLLSLDGFRADYLDRFPTPHLDRLAKRGVRSAGLVPVFPSKTFPNHYTLVTGLYADRHGIVANQFWDPRRGAAYTLRDRDAVRDGTWYGGEPIWVTAERQGMVSASFHWPGSEAAIGGVRPTFWRPYDAAVPNDSLIDQVLQWLRLPPRSRPHLVTAYLHDVDDAGHRFGPEDARVGDAVWEVDRALGRLVDGVAALPFADQVNLIVVSDHGMARYGPDTFVALDALIDTAGVRVADAGPNANLFVAGPPARARAVRDSLNARLRHGRAFLRAEVPPRLHYRRTPRVGDVVIVMDEHYTIGLAAQAPRAAGGTHGWDPALSSMHGIFLAAGPGIRRGQTIPAFQNVHVYPLLADLLGLRPAAGTDGQRAVLAPIRAPRRGP